ncbi:MAG: sulfotransferase domain-containing protein [Isosphaeraceae bacterium]
MTVSLIRDGARPVPRECRGGSAGPKGSADLLDIVRGNLHDISTPYPFPEIPTRVPRLVVTCYPKCGSTYLVTLLSRLLDWPHVPLSYAYERSEQDLYLPALLFHDRGPLLTQHHLRATGPNLQLIEAAGIKVIVLVRNLADALVSLRDHLVNEGPHAPVCYVTERFGTLRLDQQLDWLIDLAAPWYVHFYTSWQHAAREGKVSPLWLTYDDVVKDTPRTLGRILEFVGVRHDPEQVARAMAELPRDRSVRFNQGVAGRGSMFTPWQRARLRRLCGHDPDVDFTPLLRSIAEDPPSC